MVCRQGYFEVSSVYGEGVDLNFRSLIDFVSTFWINCRIYIVHIWIYNEKYREIQWYQKLNIINVLFYKRIKNEKMF